MMSFLRAHKRAIAFSLIVAWAAFPLMHPRQEWLFWVLILRAIFLIIIASQIFWIRRVLDLGERFIPGKPRRAWLAVVASVVYLLFFAYSFAHFGIFHQLTTRHMPRPADPRLRAILIEGALSCWLLGSLVGFLLVVVFGTVDRAARAVVWAYCKARKALTSRAVTPKPAAIALDPPSPARRRFLEQTAIALSATPFAVASYGLLYGRIDLEVTRLRIRLARLPRAFEGFRIAQLSDIHINPFMPADQIRRCVAITNRLKPDLVAMTGDYVLWDPAAQGEVVQALADLRAPYGVFGCLGNHETITQTEESITRLFAARGIRILRQERAPIRLRGEMLNLIGIDDSLSDLRALEQLVVPDAVNILLSHFPELFDRAVELGIDLTLAGHIHGGQVSLEFVHRGLCVGRLETRYVSGWYEKRGGQLYVNRGIGTTVVPIRFAARPEITLFELMRA